LELGVLFYHPKNPQNVTDIGTIAKYLNAQLYIIQRPSDSSVVKGLSMVHDLGVKVFSRFEDALRGLPRDALYIVLETYGRRLLNELEVSKDKQVVVVLGAEDYGIPLDVAERLPGKKVYVKIPVAVSGSSYNVVSSLVMALYEIHRRLIAGKA
jgi:tRNA (cytidine/uridine-2'-O-)-methyltransferase